MAKVASEKERKVEEDLKKKSKTHRYSAHPPTFESSMDALESGKMGKLLIYKSGKIKLKLGDILFDLTPGTTTKFHQEVVCATPLTSVPKIYFFGDIVKTMVVTPDVADCLSHADFSDTVEEPEKPLATPKRVEKSETRPEDELLFAKPALPPKKPSKMTSPLCS